MTGTFAKRMCTDDGFKNLAEANFGSVCITARASGKHSQALPLRTYNYVHDPSLPTRDPNFGVQDLDLLIWEAARATSAAPFYFKIYTKRDAKSGELRRYKDGYVQTCFVSHAPS